MGYLIAVSLLWAFSFGLIKNQLVGLDSYWVATIRLGLASLVFLPFLRPRAIQFKLAGQYLGIGAIQFGMMYVLYIASFQHLQAHEVAMFTIFTPIYVVIFAGLRQRRVNLVALAAAGVAGVGAAVLRWQDGISVEAFTGFLMLQGANLCFAVGQVLYRDTRRRYPEGKDHGLFAWLYIGAVLGAGLLALVLGDLGNFSPSTTQWGILLYLGVLATGLGFFGWNLGATKVATGTLAVANNWLIPLAVLVALVVFGESASLPHLLLSLGIMALAVVIAKRSARRETDQTAAA